MAIAAGSEEAVKNLPIDEIPENMRDYKFGLSSAGFSLKLGLSRKTGMVMIDVFQ